MKKIILLACVALVACASPAPYNSGDVVLTPPGAIFVFPSQTEATQP